MEEVPRRTSLAPLAYLCSLFRLLRVETEGLVDYQERALIIPLCGGPFAPSYSVSIADEFCLELFCKNFGCMVFDKDLGSCRCRQKPRKCLRESAGTSERGCFSKGVSAGSSVTPKNQERISSLNITILGGISCGCPGGYPGGRPGPKAFTPPLGTQEKRVLCVEVLDPKARTSMTRGARNNSWLGQFFRAGKST